MTRELDRRDWLKLGAKGVIAAICPTAVTLTHGIASAADSTTDSPTTSKLLSESTGRCTLSIGTYAFPKMRLEKSIPLVAGIGYDAIEIAARPGFDGDPSRLPRDRRHHVRQLLSHNNLKLTSLMGSLQPSKDEKTHANQIQRLAGLVELGRDLSGNRPPLIQSVLGGGEWEKKKHLYRDRLADWVEVTKKAGVVLAIKPHRGHAMSRPSEAIWIIKQLDDTPWLRIVYDQSHFVFRDMPLDTTVATAMPYVAHIAVKDAENENGRIEFKLPGEGNTINYEKLLGLFHKRGYRGDVCCEVSAGVWKKLGYDPVAAAKICYRNMASVLRKIQPEMEKIG